jgi:hypothetical protein
MIFFGIETMVSLAEKVFPVTITMVAAIRLFSGAASVMMFGFGLRGEGNDRGSPASRITAEIFQYGAAVHWSVNAHVHEFENAKLHWDQVFQNSRALLPLTCSPR